MRSWLDRWWHWWRRRPRRYRRAWTRRLGREWISTAVPVIPSSSCAPMWGSSRETWPSCTSSTAICRRWTFTSSATIPTYSTCRWTAARWSNSTACRSCRVCETSAWPRPISDAGTTRRGRRNSIPSTSAASPATPSSTSCSTRSPPTTTRCVTCTWSAPSWRGCRRKSTSSANSPPSTSRPIGERRRSRPALFRPRSRPTWSTSKTAASRR